jgi:glycosyltransferase involved in cell wall biosynthesis
LAALLRDKRRVQTVQTKVPMARAPLISVIVPVHDVAAHVGACLHSLRAQTFDDFEVIVVDDGSADASAARAREAMAGDSRFRLLSRTHAGLSAARNAGLAEARGEFIAFVDGDDRVMPDFLGRMRGALEETGGDWVACAVRYVFADGTGATHSGSHTAPDLGAHVGLRRHGFSGWPDVVAHFPSAWNKLYRRSLIEGLRYDEGTWFEDHGFFLRTAARTDHLIHLPEPLYLQTQGRAGQITGRDDDRVFEQFPVLERAGATMANGPHDGAEVALATLSHRLIAERASVLAAPERRARFARAAASFLDRAGIARDGACASWREEMAGRPPLSVVIRWDGAAVGALSVTLGALAGGAVLGHEAVILCPRPEDAAALGALEVPPHIRAVPAAEGAGAARGALVIVLDAGAQPDPHVLHAQARALLEAGGDLGVMGEAAPEGGRFAPDAALARRAPLAAHMIRGALIRSHDLRLADAGGIALCLGASLMAERVVSLPGAVFEAATAADCMAADFLADHDACIAALPAAARARLPEGWERRLFLRALWRHWQPEGRRAMVAALIGGIRRGYGRRGAPPAGVDADVPAWLVSLLDPRTAPRALLAPLDEPAPPAAPPPVAREALRPFALDGTGWLRFRADLAAAPFANLSFYGMDRVAIPFHLSVRRDAGQVVLNDRDAAGHWRAEIAQDVPLGPRVVEGVIRLTGRDVTVTLEEAPVARVEAGARFGGLDKVAFVESQGPITLLDVVPGWSGRGPVLDEGWLLRVPEGVGCLRAGPDEARLPVIASAGVPGGLVPLPGWLWAGLPEGATLDIVADDPARSVLRLTRTQMAACLEAALAHRLEPEDMPRSLLVLEHLVHGGFAPLLSSEGQARARALAAHFGMAGELGLAPVPEATPETGREAARALARFAGAMSATPAPAARDVLPGLAVPAKERRALCLGLVAALAAEAHDGADFDGALAMARAAGLAKGPLPSDPWSRAALLPVLLAEGQTDAVHDVLWSLVPSGEAWLPTSCIAHVARHALRARRVDPDRREALIYGYIDFVTRRLADPWGRAHCRELTRTAVALLGQRALMSRYLAADLEAFCLRAYGLSRLFWEAVEAQGVADLPPRLAEAQAAFRQVEQARGGLDGALRLFEAAGNPDAARVAREMGCAVPGEPVRAWARPGAGDVPEAEMAGLRAALPKLYPETAPPRHTALQRACAEMIEAALAAPDTCEACPLFDRLDLIAGAQAQYLGLGLGLSLVAGLKDGALRAEGLDWLAVRLRDLPEARRAALAAAPSVRQGAARLRAARIPGSEPLLDALGPGAPLPPRCAALGPAHPLYDTLVVIFTCAPYLETRAPALRAGWLRLLEEMGIAHVFVTGGGDGRLEGDVLRLDAPDDYEGLPQKTLAAIRWVHDQTDFGHMLKIDDDCFLNAPEFFRALNYRRFDYYGRKLSLVPGQMDRRWHQGKSTSHRARSALDKSPEPSSYADGGSGYALSRRAMAEVLAAMDSTEGRLLERLSFMEDKLIGDLLALRGIEVAEDGYYTAVRRRSHAGARPVSSWHNGFLASRAMPVQMVHLDSAEDQAPALARLASPALWPKKIWPGFHAARLGAQSNALDLISSEASAEAARAAPVAVVSVMRNEMFLLPHFLRHYRGLGVERFVIADNGSDDGTLEYLAEQRDVTLFSVDTDYRRSAWGVAWQQAMLAEFRLGKWSLVADADELLVWQAERRQSLQDLLASPEFEGADAARLFMLDMYPEGPLEGADFASGDPFAEAGFAERTPFLRSTPMRGPFSDQPTWTSALRHRLIPDARPEMFVAQKIALLRYHPFMRLSAGLHFVGDVRLARRELILGHFKYNAEFRRKAETEVARGQHWGNAEEYRRYLALVSEGRRVIFDPGVSLPWHEVPFVAARLG